MGEFARGVILAGGLMMAMTLQAGAQAPEVKFAQNGEATIEYRAEGKGPLVIFLASTARGTEEFGPFAKRMAERGFRVLRPEPRGIGGSKGKMEGVTFHDFAADFAAVIKAEGGGPAIVAGHAYGNWIARTIAADFPALTRGVVLVAATSQFAPAELSAAIRRINDPAVGEEQRLKDLRYAFFAPGSDPRPWLHGWHPEVLTSQRAARTLTNRADWWAAGKAPILDLQADPDPFRPEETRQEFRKEFGEDRVTVKVITGAGHALPFELPRETADAIADWANGLKAGG